MMRKIGEILVLWKNGPSEGSGGVSRTVENRQNLLEEEKRAKEWSQKLIQTLISIPDKQTAIGTFNKWVAYLKGKLGTRYMQSRFHLQAQIIFLTLQKDLYDGVSGARKPDFKGKCNVLCRALRIAPVFTVVKQEKASSEIVRQVAYMQKYTETFLAETHGKNTRSIVIHGKIRDERMFENLEKVLVQKCPDIPREKIQNYLANVKASILANEEMFQGTKLKTVTYAGFNFMRNVPGAKNLQAKLGAYLRGHGVKGESPTPAKKKEMVDNFIRENQGLVDTLTILPKVDIQTVRNYISGLIDMAYDVRNVTLSGGKFHNTADEALAVIARDASFGKGAEVLSLSAIGKVGVKNLRDLFKNGGANVPISDFRAIMGSRTGEEQNKVLKEGLGESGYRAFCLFVAAKGYQSRLYDGLSAVCQKQVENDADKFLEEYRNLQFSSIPEGFSLPKVKIETLKSYFQNPNLENLKNLIRESGVEESEILGLLKKIRDAARAQKKEDIQVLRNTDETLLNQEVIVSGVRKKLRHLTTSDAENLLSTQRSLLPEVREYLQVLTRKTDMTQTISSVGIVERKIQDNKQRRTLHHSAHGITMSQEEQKMMNRLQGDIQTSLNIAENQSNIETLEITNNFPNNLNLSDPIAVEFALKSGSLSPDQKIALGLIQANHREISEQITLYQKIYGETEAKQFVGEVLGKSDTKTISLYQKYQYLETNAYSKRGDETRISTYLIENLKPSDEPLTLYRKSNTGTSMYNIQSTGLEKRDIRDQDGNIIIGDVPAWGVLSTIEAMDMLSGLRLGGLRKFLPLMRDEMAKRGIHSNPLDGNFDPKETKLFLGFLVDFLGLEQPSGEIRNNPIELEGYIQRQSNTLSFGAQLKKVGVYDENFIANSTRVQNRCREVLINST